MDKKIIFFDIDGTILSHRTHEISASTKNAIKQAQANGHLAVINTGRVASFINNPVLEIGFDGFIYGCGTHITYQDKTLHQITIPTNLSKMLMKDLLEMKIEAVLEGSKAVYLDYNSTSPIIKSMIEYQEKHNFKSKSWEASDVVFDKFCIWPTTEESAKLFYNKYKDTFDFIKREGKLYEVVPRGYSKASGIKYLINHLDIPFDNTYALGDGENDLPMLTYAKHTIAMGNAPQAIKDIVTFVTEDVDQDGVAHALQHFNCYCSDPSQS